MRSARVVGYVDENGEVHEGVIPVLCHSRTPSPFGRSWMQFNQEFLDELANRRDIGNEALRVFLKLNARLDFENVILLSQTEIAEQLGMKKQAVNRAIKKLELLGIILRGPSIGRTASWRLNPLAGWKGKIAHLHQEHRNLEVVRQKHAPPPAPKITS